MDSGRAMRTKLWLSLICGVFAAANPKQAFAQADEFLTNKSIIRMARAGLGQDVIIRKIKDSKTNFDLSTDGLINLKVGGVRDKVIEAMWSQRGESPADKGEDEAASPSVDASSVVDGKRKELDSPVRARLGAADIQPRPNSSRPPLDILVSRVSLDIEQNYYAWRGDLNRGSQWITPLTLGLRLGSVAFGIRRAYIRSAFTGRLGGGEVSTWSDTSMSAAYSREWSRWSARLNLDVNAPTGKASLKGNEKLAVMDGSLVQQTRFGEGWNLGPGIAVTRLFGNHIGLALGFSHLWRGRFDPNSDVINDEINPGDEKIVTAQGQFRTSRQLFILGATGTMSGPTQRAGRDYYRKGERIDVSLTGVASLPYEMQMRAYFRYSTQRPDHYINNVTGRLQEESANSNGDSLFVSLDWGKTLAGRHIPRVLADVLVVRANSYDAASDLYNAGRNKYGLGAGYDFYFSKRSKASVQAKWFSMKDKANPATLRDTRYSGMSVYAAVGYDF